MQTKDLAVFFVESEKSTETLAISTVYSLTWRNVKHEKFITKTFATLQQNVWSFLQDNYELKKYTMLTTQQTVWFGLVCLYSIKFVFASHCIFKKKLKLFMNTIAIIYCYCNYLNACTTLFIQTKGHRNRKLQIPDSFCLVNRTKQEKRY